MFIRIATIQDAEAIAQNNLHLAEESEHLTIDAVTALSGVRAVLIDPTKGFFLVAEEKKQIIGQLMITFEWSDWHNNMMWWIQSVYVRTPWRRKKVFSKLFQEIRHRAKEYDVELIRLYVHTSNTPAQQTYQDVGMEKAPYEIYQIHV